MVVPAPSNLTATRTANGIRLAWKDPSNGKASFKIERKTGDQGTYREIATIGPGKVAYEDPAAAGKTCSYRIRAFVGAGKSARYSAYSNEAGLSAALAGRVRLRPANLANPALIKPGPATPPKVLTIPAVIDAPGTLTVTGGQPPA